MITSRPIVQLSASGTTKMEGFGVIMSYNDRGRAVAP